MCMYSFYNAVPSSHFILTLLHPSLSSTPHPPSLTPFHPSHTSPLTLHPSHFTPYHSPPSLTLHPLPHSTPHTLHPSLPSTPYSPPPLTTLHPSERSRKRQRVDDVGSVQKVKKFVLMSENQADHSDSDVVSTEYMYSSLSSCSADH